VKDGVVLGPYGDTKAPHPVRKGVELSSAALCTQCHQANVNMTDVDLACLFDTGESFASGPWAQEGKICQDCHMPPVDRPLVVAVGSPVRKTRHHWFGGSLIPKKPEFEAELAPAREVYPNGARIEWVSVPEKVPPGRKTRLEFAVSNAEAGHTLPTGDVERFIVVTARVRDRTGQVVAERVERFGSRYQWYPTTVKLDDTRLLPRETRTFPLEFTAPRSGPLSLSLEGWNNRMNDENLAYHNLQGRYVAGRMFHRSEIQLPID